MDSLLARYRTGSFFDEIMIRARQLGVGADCSAGRSLGVRKVRMARPSMRETVSSFMHYFPLGGPNV
jgi:hypothetical protein